MNPEDWAPTPQAAFGVAAMAKGLDNGRSGRGSVYIETMVGRVVRFRPDRFTLFLAAIAVLGSFLILLRIANGVGVMGDSGPYLSTARKLTAGEGWLLWPSIYNASWPPAYPTLLALASGFAFDPRGVAGPLNAAAFGLTIFIAGHWLRQRVQSRFLAALGCLAILVSIPVVWAASWVWSESVFILITTLALFHGDNHLKSGKRSSLVWGAVFTSLACLTRYSGAALILGFIPLIVLHRGTDSMEKARRIGLYLAISIAPICLYMLRNVLSTGTLTGSRTSSNDGLLFNIQRTLETLEGWNPLVKDYLPSSISTEATLFAALAGAATAGYSILRWMRGRNGYDGDRSLAVAGSFVFAYIAFMVATATVTELALNQLDSRLLSPVYVPLALVVVFAIDNMPRYCGDLSSWVRSRNLPIYRHISWIISRRIVTVSLAAPFLLCIVYAGYITARDTHTAVINPSYGWNAIGWNARNIRIPASSYVDDHLRRLVGDDEPIVRSTFDIYLDEDMLIYTRDMCSMEDSSARFFLHVIPVNAVDLPGIRKQYGFDNFDFEFNRQGAVLNGECLAEAPLPGYDIAYITTGQYSGGQREWEVEIRLDE